MYKKLFKLNHKKKSNNLIRKWTKIMKRYFYEENIQMANKHMKRCSTSLVIKDRQIKTTVRYNYTPIGTAKIKK